MKNTEKLLQNYHIFKLIKLYFYFKNFSINYEYVK
ncbi:hypothetical protein MUGA111182_11555 [Mucilaginibacter galii]